MESHLAAWERDYRRRGRLWGGGAKNLPYLPEGSAVLEIGCGDGKTLSAMPGGWTAIGLDISREALRLCRQGLPRSEVILADARRMPFRDGSFDALFAFHVAGHLPAQDRTALAKEAFRVLRRGGALFFREFAAEDMRAGNGQEVEIRTFQRQDGILTHYFTEAEVQGLFGDLEPGSIRTRRWQLRIMGKDLVRAEVEAVLFKS